MMKSLLGDSYAHPSENLVSIYDVVAFTSRSANGAFLVGPEDAPAFLVMILNAQCRFDQINKLGFPFEDLH